MKSMKYIFLALSSLFATHLYASEIDAANGTFSTSNATGTKTQSCQKILFLKRNVGTLVTGLKTSNLKFYAGTHIADNTSPTSGRATDSITPAYTLAATTMPGVYNLCITPYDFTWTIADGYEFRFVLNGLTAADNGSFILKFQN